MKHLGDITKISGSNVSPVNVVIGGSPCQDLSIAGKRAGLAGERSGLFMEQLRIIKEMRKADEDRGRKGKDIRPRFMVWENVPGAFSSNKGADFGAVLQETVRVVCEKAPAVSIPKNGWPTAGCLTDVGGKWSVAWRVFDAQFWGVPQRRRRIALVADFGGCAAPEILFERKGVFGDSAPCGETGQATPGTAEASTSGHDRVLAYGGAVPYTLKVRSGCPGGGKGALVQTDKSATLSTLQDQTLFQPVAYSFDSLASNSMKSANPHSGCREVDKSCTLDTTRPDPAKNQGGIAICQPAYCPDVAHTLRAKANCAYREDSETYICQSVAYGIDLQGGKGICGYGVVVCPTMASGSHGTPHAVAYPIVMQQNASGEVREGAVVGTINTNSNASGRNTPIVAYQTVDIDCRNGTISPVATTLQARTGHTLNAGCVVGHPAYCLQGNGIGRSDNAGCNGAGWNEGVCYTLNTTDRPAVAYDPKAVFDARGNGDGNIAPTIMGDHENRITDDSAVLVEKIIRWIVRRLTPLECERLQGFPDGWTDIGDWVDSKGRSRSAADSPRYKALGNSIALPSWFYVLRKLSLYCGLDCTMASLFDGIGGFPLIWESLNGKGSCLWASEIEEFPIAVTSIRFSDDK